MLRQTLARMSRETALRDRVVALPGVDELVERFVAGETVDETLVVASDLAHKGLETTIDVLGEDTTSEDQAEGVVIAYESLLQGIARARLADTAEVSVKLSAIGLTLGRDGEALALANARRIVAAAEDAGTMVTIDMEDHTLTDATLGVVAALRETHPETGCVIQAYLRRTESDARELAASGARVRLCKGAYSEPEGVAFTDRHQIDLSFVRCLKVLMSGGAHVMVATHDPRLVEITGALVKQYGLSKDDFEFQMLHGVRPLEQRRLVDVGNHCRVYLPMGSEWYGYFMRRVAERPANATLILRQLVSRR